MVGVLRGDAALRRALTDNSVEGDSRSGLATAVFGSAVGDKAATWSSTRPRAAGPRPPTSPRPWSGSAVVPTVRSAGAKGTQVGDELFGVRRMVDTSAELRSALADPSRTSADRGGLLAGLLSGKVESATETLVAEAVSRGRGSVDAALDEYLELAAEALEETVVTVHTARELSDADQQRLSDALSRQYSTTVQLHVVLDPALIGGLKVEIGDDVIDGTVANRLDDARRHVAG